MLFMPSEVTLNVRQQQHFVILGTNNLLILKMFSDVRNSEVRCATVSLSVPLTYTEDLLYFLTLQETFWDYLSGYSLLTCDVAPTADQLATFLQNLANLYQTARRHCQTLVLPIALKDVHTVLGCDTVWSGGYVRIFCTEYLQGGPTSLKMEAEIHFEIFVHIYQIIRCHIAESSNPGTVPYHMSVYMPTLC
jgi:hypothetical protein